MKNNVQYSSCAIFEQLDLEMAVECMCTAVSRKVVRKKRKSARDNPERYCG